MSDEVTDDDDAEQLEANRQTVAQLVGHGDVLTKPRPVDHWLYFATAAERDRFLGEVVPLGFEVADKHGDARPPRRFCARVCRVDRVDLESIHRAVMTLFAAAKRNAGEYDGWECPVERE